VINGDNIEDHVTEFNPSPTVTEDVSGHIPDFNIDLGGHNPASDGIHAC
jgi:hypothetical protein